ncbi:MAG TPA: hypothetical protein VM734_06725 [Kofleriaceae bacterium]|nr:hypothetical protein [Kofleriaceae bacterium]
MRIAVAVASALAAMCGIAAAQQTGACPGEETGEACPPEPAPVQVQPAGVEYAEMPSEPLIGHGFGFYVGGGVDGFLSDTVNDLNSVSGTWDARFVVGTRSRIAFEAAYVGSAGSIDALLGPGDGTLIGSSVVGNVRLNILVNDPWQPFVFVGAGWTNYTITDNDFSLAANAMQGSDNLFTMPLGVGMAYRFDQLGIKGLSLDARALFNVNFGEDLVANDVFVDDGVVIDEDVFFFDNNSADMSTWAVNARVGYEF